MSARADGGAVPALPDEYDRFCAFMHSFVGIDLHQYKRRQMERRIRSFAERRSVSSLDAYQGLLSADSEELNGLLDRITINVSQLFRNPEQWERLGSEVIPELVGSDGGRIRAWSAGCSFGAEAYSLAATVREVAPRARLTIRASDIDRRILDAAGRGFFTEDDARSAPRRMLETHFRQVPGGWQAGPELRAVVQFHQEDLLRTRPAPGSFDLVLCRNVVIYFTPEAREAVHSMLAASLRPGGYLVIGSTERVAQNLAELKLEQVRPFVYRRTA